MQTINRKILHDIVFKNLFSFCSKVQIIQSPALELRSAGLEVQQSAVRQSLHVAIFFIFSILLLRLAVRMFQDVVTGERQTDVSVLPWSLQKCKVLFVFSDSQN